MEPANSALRRRTAAIAEAKPASAASDAAAHLALPAGERLLVTLQHADAHLQAFPPQDGALDADREAWERVRRHLQRPA